MAGVPLSELLSIVMTLSRIADFDAFGVCAVGQKYIEHTILWYTIARATEQRPYAYQTDSISLGAMTYQPDTLNYP